MQADQTKHKVKEEKSSRDERCVFNCTCQLFTIFFIWLACCYV